MGFGPHKCLCHLGFRGYAENVAVVGNVSVRDSDDAQREAGVNLNATDVRNVVVANNELYDYALNGVNVDGGVRGFTVTGNLVSGSGEAGRASPRWSSARARTPSQTTTCGARGVAAPPSPTRRAAVGTSTLTTTPPATTRGPSTTPPRRSATWPRRSTSTAGAPTATATASCTMSFDRPYARRPSIRFGRRGGGIRSVEYATDSHGDYVGARVRVADDGGRVDLFVGD